MVGALGLFAAVLIRHEMQKPLPDLGQLFLVALPSQLAKVSLDFGDGKKREFRGALTPNMSALEALSISTDIANLPLSHTPTKEGVQIAMIDGKKTEKKKRWVFYINGKIGGDPATYQMKAGDGIEWRYQ